jgi:hypothetical protein
MKKICLLTIAFFLAGFHLIAQTVQLPFDSDHWNLSGVQTKTETYEGKECLLLNSGSVFAKGVDLRDGTLEFDISVPQQRGFPGIGFRVADPKNYEHFYVRPHQSGNPDANQYTPVFNDHAGWQLYYGEGYSKAFPYKFNQWHHIKIDMHGITAEIYIDDMQTPAIKVKELKRGWKSGNIGLIGGNIPTRYANVQYVSKQVSEPAAIPVPANGANGLITKYQVSNAVSQQLFANKWQLTPDIKSKLQWTSRSTEYTGIINLGKFTKANDSANTMVCKIIIESETDQVKAMPFGFSDFVIVYLNDQALFIGKDNYMSRDYRFLGTIGFFDILPLRLKKGKNELWFVISENFGGWGLQAMFDNMSGIKLL